MNHISYDIEIELLKSKND